MPSAAAEVAGSFQAGAKVLEKCPETLRAALQLLKSSTFSS